MSVLTHPGSMEIQRISSAFNSIAVYSSSHAGVEGIDHVLNSGDQHGFWWQHGSVIYKQVQADLPQLRTLYDYARISNIRSVLNKYGDMLFEK